MFGLYATKDTFDYPEGFSTVTDLIAIFDTEELAQEYVKKSKLKHKSFQGPFRQKSLLAYYDSCYIQEFCPPPNVPVNPDI